MRVLLVDDHALFRAGVAALLRAWDIEVVGEAEDGLAALEQARRLRPDVILMDVTMPRCDGLQATRLITAEMPEAKIVMMTVSQDDQHLFEAIKAGAKGYLLKDMGEAEFNQTLHRIDADEVTFSAGLARRVLDEFARIAQERRSAAATPGELTHREREVLQLVSRGSTNRQVAAALGVSENTVGFHMKNILAKLHLGNRAQAVAYAFRTGLAETPGPDEAS